MRALILVDLQYDFCSGGALAVAHGDQAVAVARRVMPSFPIVVATQDWHPPDHGSFAANRGRAVGELGELGGVPQVMWPPHCVQGTRGAELHDDLPRGAIDHVSRKGTDATRDSYSGFFDNADAAGDRRATDLDAYLRDRGVRKLAVLGLATDYCVRATALDARALGYDVSLVVDGCRAVDLAPGDGERAIAEMRAAGIRIVDSAQVSLRDRRD